MRAGDVLTIACLFSTLGCGDGVGRPIVERESTSPGAGSRGSAAAGGSGYGARDGSGRGDFPAYGGRGFSSGGFDSTGVPSGEHCASVADWPEEAESGEALLLGFLNFAREFGFSCTTGATGVALPPVVMKPELRCAARLHSRDMFERDFFLHVNPDQVGPEDRIRQAGYSFRVAGESIAEGESPTQDMVPYQALEQLFSAGGMECSNLVDPGFDSVGIGRFEDLWTLDFAGP